MKLKRKTLVRIWIKSFGIFQKFFFYDLKEFYDNKELHTFDFETLFVANINFNSEDENQKNRRVINNFYFEEGQLRWKTYMPPI